MDKIKQTKPILKVVLILGVCIVLILLGTAGRSLYGAAAQERSTYSIVAVDPVTGDVGVAGASCVPISAGGMTTLVPGKGAAVTQAAFSLQNQTKVFELLRQGVKANEIIKIVSDNSYDTEVEIRQYGVVTLNEGIIEVAGFTGKANNDWAGDQQDSTMAVSVQGNTLEDATVVSSALIAYSEDGESGAVELPDRLLRALEAASAAGGDRRCNQANFQQTAQAAFIAVAKADQLPFAATIGRDPAPDDPARAWLYISVIEPKGGPNPLLELRNQYNDWRFENLPPCMDCEFTQILVPTGGDAKPLSKAFLQMVSRIGLVGVGVGVGCLAGFVLLVCFAGIIYLWKRKRRSST